MIMRQVPIKVSNVTIGFCTQSRKSKSDVIFAFAYCEQATTVIIMMVQSV